MKFKLVPNPPERLDTVEEARRAVPLVPGSENDCCALLMDRLSIPNRDEARIWLTFLRALGLVEERSTGFTRTRDSFDRAELAAAFRDGVYGAEALLSILEAADGPLDSDDAFERFEERVPTWERHKDPTRWRNVWRDRVVAMLGWLALLGLAEAVDGGYRRE